MSHSKANSLNRSRITSESGADMRPHTIDMKQASNEVTTPRQEGHARQGIAVGVLLLTLILSVVTLSVASPGPLAHGEELSVASGTVPLPSTVRNGDKASFDAFASQMLIEALPDDKEAEWVAPSEGLDDVPDSMMLRAESVRDEMPSDTDAAARTYDLMLPHARAVALGTEHATEVSFQASEVLGTGNCRWTGAQLGINLDTATASEIEDALIAMLASLGIFKGENALMTDYPQYFYWTDKAQPYGYWFTYGYGGPTGGKTAYVNQITLYFPVASPYRATQSDQYTTCSQLSAPVTTAIDTATEIADRWRAQVPLQRVRKYMDEVCDLTDYNTAVLDWDLDDIAANGSDPWQIIWVFDGDPDSKVVCEGYSKALKYLCDLSGRTDIECRIVSGYLNSKTEGSRHMWNVIRMDDGQSYLVDATNCDSGSSGYPYRLCLQKPVSLSSGWYAFSTSSSSGQTKYLYDDQTEALHSAGFLALAMTDYVPPSGQLMLSDAEVTLEYQTHQYEYDLVQVDGELTRVPREQRPDVTVSYYGLTLEEGVDYVVGYSDNAHAGTATVTVSPAEGSRYEGSGSATFEITRMPVTVTASDVTVPYGDAYPTSFEVTVTPDEPVLYEVRCGYPEGLPAGEYPNEGYSAQHPDAPAEAISFVNPQAIQGDYAVTYVPGRLIVTPLDVGFISFDPVPDQEWTGSAIEPSVVGRRNGQVIDLSDLSLSYEANTDVGEARVSVTGTGNYTSTRTLTFNILPKSVTVPTGPSSPLTYDGTEQVGVATSTSGEYLLTGAYKATNAGTYHAVASLVDQNHVWADGSHDPVTIEWSISPVTVTFSIGDVPAQSYVPGGVCPEPSVTSDPAGIPYVVSYENNTTVTDSAKVVVTSSSPNYEGRGERVFSITKGRIEVTVQDATKEYLQDDPAFTSVVTGISPDDVTVSYSRAIGEGVGSYAVSATVTGYDTNLYEEATCHPGTLRILPATAQITIGEIDPQTYTGQQVRPEPTVTTVPEGLSYEFSYGTNVSVADEGRVTVTISESEANYLGEETKTFAILPCPVTITPDDKEMTYGDAEVPSLTATVTGLPDGIEEGVGFAYSLWREQGTDANDYPIHASYGSYPNLAVTVTPAKLTIKPKPVTFEIGAMGPYPYDGTEQSPLPTSISASDANALESCQRAWSGSRRNAGDTGAFTVTATGNYTGTLTRTFSISQRPVSIVAESMALEYGSTGSPSLVASVSGVVDGEELDYDLECPVTSESPIGSYPISVVLGNNPNYDVSVTNGTLQVVEAVVTFDIGAIGDQTFTGSAIEPLPEISPSIPGAPYRVEYLNNVNAGTATIRVIATGTAYAGTSTGTFRIRKAIATVAIDDATKAYGSENPEFHATVTGNLPAAPFSYSLVCLGSNAGTYPIDAVLSNADNYDVTVTKGTLTITPIPATFEVGQIPSVMTYTGYEQRPVPEVTTVPEGVAYDLVYSGNRNVGTATVKAVAKANGNYSGEGQASFQIGKAQARVIAHDRQKMAYDADPALTATVNGALAGDTIRYSLRREDGEEPGTYSISVVLGDNPNYDVTTTGGTFTINPPSHANVDDDPLIANINDSPSHPGTNDSPSHPEDGDSPSRSDTSNSPSLTDAADSPSRPDASPTEASTSRRGADTNPDGSGTSGPRGNAGLPQMGECMQKEPLVAFLLAGGSLFLLVLAARHETR